MKSSVDEGWEACGKKEENGGCMNLGNLSFVSSGKVQGVR